MSAGLQDGFSQLRLQSPSEKRPALGVLGGEGAAYGTRTADARRVRKSVARRDLERQCLQRCGEASRSGQGRVRTFTITELTEARVANAAGKQRPSGQLP